MPGVPRAPRRLVATLYTYAFFDEFVLLYPLYTLLFARTGLSTGQISSLFVLWSVTSIVLEVPSGAWADAVSRKALLCAGPLVGALGFGLWVAVPTYWAFAAPPPHAVGRSPTPTATPGIGSSTCGRRWSGIDVSRPRV